MVSNNISAFFCRVIRICSITVYTEVRMHIKATIVAFACLRVNANGFKNMSTMKLYTKQQGL